MKLISFIKKQNLRSWLDKISKNFDIYLPVQDKKRNIIDFMNWEIFIKKEEKFKKDSTNSDRYEINLTEKTKNSPKYIFFPPTERLFEFEYKKDIKNPDLVDIDLKTFLGGTKSKNLSDNKKEAKTNKKIVFGIKPCDISAIKRLDTVFGEGDIKDPYYLERRNENIFISIGCSKTYPNCFCTSVGGNPFNFEHADIGMVEIEDGYVVTKLNTKVKWLVEENKEFFKNENLYDKYKDKIDSIVNTALEKISSYWDGIALEEIPSTIEKTFNLDIWKNISRKCISCAACTYVCPTCFCFNVRDEQKDLKGERYRCWDYCMNYYYNLEASGHNPRSEIYKRYKNKVNCKYNYHYKRSNQIYCVGCGRCIDICPVGMDIREVVDKICRAKL